MFFAAAPALHAQDYGYGRPYGYDRDYRYDRGRDGRYERELEKLQHDRQELNRALYRRDYRAARREEREIAERERRLNREFGRRGYARGYDRDDRYWNR